MHLCFLLEEEIPNLQYHICCYIHLQFGARMIEEGPSFLFLGGIEFFLSEDCHLTPFDAARR